MTLAALPATVRALGDAQQALDAIADAFAAQTATIHRADPQARLLHLVAWRGLPAKLVEITRRIPYGKGMAGICVERGTLVEVCNLQRDDSGAAKPGAKETGVAGAIVVPCLDDAGRVAGTLGVGKSAEHTYSDEEKEVLCAVAHDLARLWKDPPTAT